MRTLKGIMRERLADPGFKCLFDEECCACSVTVRICAALEDRSLTPETLAVELGEDSRSLLRLLEADDCDPQLVCRVATHLGITPPEQCSRK